MIALNYPTTRGFKMEPNANLKSSVSSLIGFNYTIMLSLQHKLMNKMQTWAAFVFKSFAFFGHLEPAIRAWLRATLSSECNVIPEESRSMDA